MQYHYFHITDLSEAQVILKLLVYHLKIARKSYQ